MKSIPYSSLTIAQQQIVLGGSSSHYPAPVLTLVSGVSFSWEYSGTEPDHWDIYRDDGSGFVLYDTVVALTRGYAPVDTGDFKITGNDISDFVLTPESNTVTIS